MTLPPELGRLKLSQFSITGIVAQIKDIVRPERPDGRGDSGRGYAVAEAASNGRASSFAKSFLLTSPSGSKSRVVRRALRVGMGKDRARIRRALSK